MRIVSWNVNGIRARVREGLLKALDSLKPDIICLQEVRATPIQLSVEARDFFNDFGGWRISNHEKAGYAGVLTAWNKRVKPDIVFEAFDLKPEKGRQVITQYYNFDLVNVYSPNAGRNLERLEHRLNWEKSLNDFVINRGYGPEISPLVKNKPLIICGDMNVAPTKVDCNVYSLAGTSKEERFAFSELIKNNSLKDAYRHLHPYRQEYTWFSNTYDSRAANKGMRIDHFLVSESITNTIQNVQIITNPELCCGSDHCPIVLDIDIQI